MIRTVDELREVLDKFNEEYKGPEQDKIAALVQVVGGSVLTVVLSDLNSEILGLKCPGVDTVVSFVVVVQKMLQGKLYMIDLTHPDKFVEFAKYKEELKALNRGPFKFNVYKADISYDVRKVHTVRELPRAYLKF